MRSQPSPAIAAILSFLLPGLGHAYAGAPRRGVLWAIPTVVALVALFGILRGNTAGLLGLVFHSQGALAFVIADVALFFYHLAAVFDAYGFVVRRARAGGHAATGVGATGRAPAALAAVIALTLVLHGVPAALGAWGSGQVGRILPGQSDIIPGLSTAGPTDSPPAGATPSPTGSPTSVAGATPSPTASPADAAGPVGAAWAADGRLNVLLIGSDAGPGRHGGRTDTMILLSVDRATGSAAMFGFPRNFRAVPLSEDANGQPVRNRIFRDRYAADWDEPGMLTNVWQRAYEEPRNFYTPQAACPATVSERDECLAEARAWRATAGAIQAIAGVQIDGVIGINLTGFSELVDAVGGVWIDVPYDVYDPRYPLEDGTKRKVIDIKAGCQKLDGTYALAFARTRRQDHDFARMKRQQLVIAAVRRQIDPIAILPEVPHLLDIAAGNLYTTFSREEIPLLVQLAGQVDADRIYRVVFNRAGGYGSELTGDQLRRIRDRVANIFSEPLPAPSPTPTGAPPCPPR